ncbi:MAG: CDP-alcohol phosphatidyltransferase family protein [Chitinophagales bacterium]
MVQLLKLCLVLKQLFKQFNSADWIASVRLFVIPVILTTTLLHWQLATAIIVFIALLTDVVDGQVARRFHMQSKFGAKLDSIGDASLFIASFCCLLLFFPQFFKAHWWQTALLMGLYLFQIVYPLIRFKRLTAYHTYAAKLSAVTEGLFITVCLFYQPIEWLFYLTWAVGLIEQIDELSLLFVLPQPKEDVKGIYWVLKKHHP